MANYHFVSLYAIISLFLLIGGNIMYAIIRQGNGKYYTSTVFGYFHDIKSTDDYQRYLERIHSPYYIVWNEAKTNLTKVFAMQSNTKYLIPQVLIVELFRKPIESPICLQLLIMACLLILMSHIWLV